VIGHPVFHVVPSMSNHVWRGILDQVRDTGVAYIGKGALEHSLAGDTDATGTYMDFVYAPLKRADGRIEGVIVMGFDVTDEILIREDLERMRTEAVAATRAKDEFVAMLAHELRSPLTPIVAALDLLRNREGASREHEIIDRQVHRLIRLVDDLLDIERIVRGRLHMRKDAVEVGDVVARAIEISAALFRQRRQHLTLNVPCGLFVEGDADRLSQAIDNPLTNASKYSDEEATIHVQAYAEGDRLRIHVKDEGAGIAPDMKERVFEGFVQQPQTIDRARGGLGLGLTIVRTIVEAHAGHVDVRSEGLGRGSEFVVDLPLAVAAAAAPLSARCSAQQSDPCRRILVVDDSDDTAETLTLPLQLLGHVVELARDLPSALASARAFQPEVVFIDIEHPGVNGYEVASRITDMSEGSDVHLVAVSRSAGRSSRRRVWAAGFQREVTRPVDVNALARLIEELGADAVLGRRQ
jgi:signal transduction histidine kinase/CheY-like chemotaxis protein